MTQKALLQSAGDGTAVPAGYVGELSGTLRSGTGGLTYSTRSTTAPTTSPSSLISITLNKGIYLISFVCLSGSTVSTFFGGYIYIGGTKVTQGDTWSTATNPTVYGSISGTIPIVITADSTSVATWGVIGAGTAVGSINEMWAVRIA